MTAGELLLPYRQHKDDRRDFTAYQEHKDGKKEDLFDTMYDMPTICFDVSTEWGLYIVVSCGAPLGNVSWMLFQEGQSSNLRLRRGVGQAAHTRNNPHVKCTEVYCA
jgi:hypothetical protein